MHYNELEKMAEKRTRLKRARPTPLSEELEEKKKMKKTRSIFIGFHIDRFLDLMEILGLNSVGLITHLLHVHDQHCPTCNLSSESVTHKKRKDNSSPNPTISLPVTSSGDFAELKESSPPLPEPVIETDYAEDDAYNVSPYKETTESNNEEQDNSGITLQLEVESGDATEEQVSVKEEPVWDEGYTTTVSQSENSNSCHDRNMSVGQSWQLSNSTNEESTITTEIKKENESDEPQQERVVPVPIMPPTQQTTLPVLVTWPVPTNLVKNKVQLGPDGSAQNALLQKLKAVVQQNQQKATGQVPTVTQRTNQILVPIQSLSGTTIQLPISVHTPPTSQQLYSVQQTRPIVHLQPSTIVQQTRPIVQLQPSTIVQQTRPIVQLQPSAILSFQQAAPQRSTETTQVLASTSTSATAQASGSLSTNEQFLNPQLIKTEPTPDQSAGSGEPPVVPSTSTQQEEVDTGQSDSNDISEDEPKKKRFKSVQINTDEEGTSLGKSTIKNTRWGVKILQEKKMRLVPYLKPSTQRNAVISEKKMRLVPYLKPSTQRNAVISGKRKKSATCTQGSSQGKSDKGEISHNQHVDRLELNDYQSEEQNDYQSDEFDDLESSGSEYNQKSSEEDDDDDDDRSVEFPIQKMTQKVRNKDNRSNSKEAHTKKSNSNEKVWKSEISEQEENLPKLKAYFENIHVETYEKINGNRNYKKTDYCCFCKELYDSKILRHILSVHKNESKVKEVQALALYSVERKMALQKLRTEGNYYHNLEVLRNREGTLIVYRRPKTYTCASEFIPCEYCYRFFHEYHLWEHAKGCYFRKNEVDSSKNYVRNGRMMLMPFMIHKERETNKLNDLIKKMNETRENPGLKKICFKDGLIRLFGMCLLQRLGTTKERRQKDKDSTSTKMRCVARLLKKLNDKNIVNKPLSNYINAREFDKVVTAVIDLCQESTPLLAKSLGIYLKQISLLKASLAIHEENDREKLEANDFLEMHAAHWFSRVILVANRTGRLRAINSNDEIPLTEDLVKLQNYVQNQIEKHMKIKTPTYEQYMMMTQLLIVRIAVFNKRIVSEVDELTVADYQKRIRGSEIDNSEIVQSMEFSERALLKRMELVQVQEKSTRKINNVYVLLSNDMITGIEHILATRMHAGVNPKNKYIFARSGSSTSPQDGCAALKRISHDCQELTKVARALVALEAGKLGNFKGRSLSSISIDELKKPVAEDDNEGDVDEVNVVDELENIDKLPCTAADTELSTTLNSNQHKCSSSDNYFKENGEELDSEMSSTEDECVQQKCSTPCNDQSSTVTVDTSVQQKYSKPCNDPSVVKKPKQNESRVFLVVSIKRNRWTTEEDTELMKAFFTNIQNKKNPTTREIRIARLKFKNLGNRTEAVIRSKINNVILVFKIRTRIFKSFSYVDICYCIPQGQTFFCEQCKTE
ncbi:hypothetical protein KUTeg_010898 [Tegillarca granosa]|uniref:Myb-like domain-containing protein n=1 Tax=Tegillarca granosa TaxID=220873 RepID=A0ABQ9F2B4_TEGGR|nr:hypothetical protein KUTeg_010898 [Tegillarca granosa]